MRLQRSAARVARPGTRPWTSTVVACSAGRRNRGTGAADPAVVADGFFLFWSVRDRVLGCARTSTLENCHVALRPACVRPRRRSPHFLRSPPCAGIGRRHRDHRPRAATTVPDDVSCLEVTVSGAQVTTQRFDVTPNQPAVITVQGLASGSATIAERAFAVPCAQVTPTTPASWLSTMPVSVTLAPGRDSPTSPSFCGARVRCVSPPISRTGPVRLASLLRW